MFKKTFSFHGRIRRLEFLLTLLVAVITTGLILFFVAFDHPELYPFFTLPVLWMVVAQAAKRCHDIGKSGWWQLVPFFNVWLLVAEGDTHPNAYGDSPKAKPSLV